MRELRAAVFSLIALAGVTLVYTRWLHVTNATIIALTFLFIVLITAAASRLRVAVSTSRASMLCFNFFFLPPVGTWTIADPQNWVALFVFLAVGLVASRLSHVARARTAEAVGRRDELARLFGLSRDVLVMTASADAVSHLARVIARRFDLEYVAITLPEGGGWSVSAAGDGAVHLDEQQLTEAFEAAATSLEFDAYARTYAGHRSIQANGRAGRLVPLRSDAAVLVVLTDHRFCVRTVSHTPRPPSPDWRGGVPRRYARHATRSFLSRSTKYAAIAAVT